MNCNKCEGTLMYIGSLKSPYDLIMENKVICDRNIPCITFCFCCRCCDNNVVVIWTDGKIEMTQNYGTSKVRYHILQELKL